MDLGLEGLTQPAADRVAVVVEDDLLVERIHHATPKNGWARRMPTTRASISNGWL